MAGVQSSFEYGNMYLYVTVKTGSSTCNPFDQQVKFVSDIQLKSATITAVGSALVDLLIHEDDAFLEAINKEKGGMTLVEDHEAQYVLSKSGQKPKVVPGGSACNTICGVAELGGRSGFIAKRGNDDFGENYETYLRGIGVTPCFYRSDTPTGRVLSVITPDAQRSMFTCLGASVEMQPDEILERLGLVG